MVDSVRKDILDDVLVQMKAILIANGFNEDVQEVFLTSRTTITTLEKNGIIIRDFLGDASRRGIRNFYERQMRLILVPVTHEVEDGKRKDTISLRLADIRKQVEANKTWGGKAVFTYEEFNTPGGGDGGEPYGTDDVTIVVTYRTKHDDPNTVAAI